MRVSNSNHGFSVHAYAGATGVLLAMDIDEQERKGLLGFAIQKTTAEKGTQWLAGMLPFPGMPHQPGQPIPSNIAPIQKFRWSDYTVEPGHQYAYDIYPVRGTPQQPVVEQDHKVSIALNTASTDLSSLLQKPGSHAVLFTRAAGSSQAFAKKFGEEAKKLDAAQKKGTKKLKQQELPPEALAWLTRGTLNEIVNFIGLAKDSSWALDIAIYQYQLPEIVQAVNAAKQRGVRIRALYHSKTNDKDTAADKKNFGKSTNGFEIKPRKTSAIFHHKFILLSQIEDDVRTPKAVLCGSTNFTFNAVYCQANEVHVTSDPLIVQKYLEHFEQIWSTPGDTGPTRQYNSQNNVLDPAAPLQAGFSPRTGETDLDLFVALINSAKRDVMFATAFNLSPKISNALLGNPHDSILRYGIQDKKSSMTGFHADRTADFQAAASLSGIEGWLMEKSRVPGQTGPILIHSKVIIVDFTSNFPFVITGSNNFSHPASASNDENVLIFRGNTEIADWYACEVLRFYDHYRFRYVSKTAKEKTGPTLTADDSWTDDYFDPAKLKYADRRMFSGFGQNQAGSGNIAVPLGKPRTTPVRKQKPARAAAARTHSVGGKK